ncbi:MAG: ribbon-helix-helix domain-containing protein [Alphaproteobacteria bacterium]|nr:ribbon-helix-helix domain-containing protein [Alphaproteobacteria bacterium]
MKKLSITLSGHRTSLTLENEFIDGLKKIAAAQKKSVAELVGEIDSARDNKTNLSSAIRVFVLINYAAAGPTI